MSDFHCTCVARGVVNRCPFHHQFRIAGCDFHVHHLGGVVVVHGHRHAVDRDGVVVGVCARRAVGQRDRIVREYRRRWTAVTVTVWAVSQFSDVKVSEGGL